MEERSTPQRTLQIVLFEGFELLDVFGPLEMFGNLGADLRLEMVAARGTVVSSFQGPRTALDATFDRAEPTDWLLVPGGFGTREAVNDAALIGWLRERIPAAELIMTVCTGTALVARTGLLDQHRATTNKRAFGWVAEQGPAVDWVREARWVRSGRFATSSGVSAGIDMALAIVEDFFGAARAEALRVATEYDWHRDPTWDPFARLHGLVP